MVLSYLTRGRRRQACVLVFGSHRDVVRCQSASNRLDAARRSS
jgi:hypothetical protein